MDDKKPEELKADEPFILAGGKSARFGFDKAF